MIEKCTKLEILTINVNSEWKAEKCVSVFKPQNILKRLSLGNCNQISTEMACKIVDLCPKLEEVYFPSADLIDDRELDRHMSKTHPMYKIRYPPCEQDSD